MITCLGIVVGIVESENTTDVLKQCANFLKTHRYLNKKGVEFEIEGMIFATVVDTHNFEDGEFGVLFQKYDNFMEAVGVY